MNNEDLRVLDDFSIYTLPGSLFTKRTDVLTQGLVKYRSRVIRV